MSPGLQGVKPWKALVPCRNAADLRPLLWRHAALQTGPKGDAQKTLQGEELVKSRTGFLKGCIQTPPGQGNLQIGKYRKPAKTWSTAVRKSLFYDSASYPVNPEIKKENSSWGPNKLGSLLSTVCWTVQLTSPPFSKGSGGNGGTLGGKS